jgi:hypothetical protein
MSNKSEIEQVLNDTEFEKKFVSKTHASDVLVSLLKKGAVDKESAILLSNYPIKPEELDPLIKNGRVQMFANSPMRIYLTDMGQIVAAGEMALRQRMKAK